MPSVIAELDATVIAAEIGAAIFAAVAVRLRYRPIRAAAVTKALGNA